MLNDIYKFIELTGKIGTAGQPNEAQLANVAAAGYEAVINLALHDAEYSLPDERATVEALGMAYIHIPVIWQNPQPGNLRDFCAAMQSNQGRKIFIHCAANKRVSVFMALYRIIYLGMSQEEAFRDMQRIWTPDGLWKDFIERILSDPDLARQV